MAEIKSTLDMVLERAAKMAQDAPEPATNEEQERVGMRLAAEWLNAQSGDLAAELQNQPSSAQMDIRYGMARTLLRNIVLPRDEMLQATGKRALQGIGVLAGKGGELGTILKELNQILEQYNQHKEQMTQQLQNAIKQQLQQQRQMGEDIDDLGGRGKINPMAHPQYQEELSRMLTSLNEQYNDAMNQRKEIIEQRFKSTGR